MKIENLQYSFQTYFKASLNNKKTQVIPFVNNQNQGFFWELEIPEITVIYYFFLKKIIFLNFLKKK